MAKTKISEFDVDPANNTDINSINIAEGCAPSGINNAIRQLMSDLKEFQTGAASDSFTVGGAFAANGGATLGDASGDALTINSSAVSIPNGLNFDSNTLVIDATNNRVGVGVASPTVTLDIVAPNDTKGLILRQNATASAGTELSLKITENTGITFDCTDGGTTARSFIFTSNATERMRLDNSGNLGLGVTPSAWYTGGSTVAQQIGANTAIISLFGTRSIFASNYYLTSGSGADTYIANGYATQYYQQNGQHAWFTAPSGTAGSAITFTQAMTLDASGNLGIGTTSPTAPLTIVNSSAGEVFRLTSSGANIYGLASDGTISAYTGGVLNGTGGFIGTSSNHPYIFRTNNTERMRIDSSGNLLLGTTSYDSSNAGNWILFNPATQWMGHTSGSTSGDYIWFGVGGTKIGSIAQNGGSAVSYNTTSDYRLKENIAPMTGALATVAQLKPVTYSWKADGSSGQGFIAHELQAVVPDCVTGEKDAVDAEGNPVYQGIDTSFLVATLTKAIQELNDKVTALEAQLNK